MDYCKRSIPNFKKQNKSAYRRMVFRKFIATDIRVAAFQLRRNTDMSMRDIAKTCGISTASVQRILTGVIPKRIATGTRRMGRPRKLSVRQQRLLVRNLRKVREQNPTFSLKDLMQASGLNRADVFERTVNRFLQSQGFHYLQTRKKGLLKKQDLTKRVRFCRAMKRAYPVDVWTRQVAFYLDGVSFAFKTNPQAEAKCPRARIWRKRGEGLCLDAQQKAVRKELVVD